MTASTLIWGTEGKKPLYLRKYFLGISSTSCSVCGLVTLTPWAMSLQQSLSHAIFIATIISYAKNKNDFAHFALKPCRSSS